MNRKNIIIWGVFVFIALSSFGLLFYNTFFVNDKVLISDKIEKKKLDPILVDQNIYAKATEKLDAKLCASIKDERIKGVCQMVIPDIILFNQAVKQFDSSLCDQLKEVERKEACKKITASGVVYLEKNDPLYLAEQYAHSHNEKALGEFEKLLTKQPDDLDVLLPLALLYAEKALNEQMRGEKLDVYVKKAFDVVEKAKKINPKLSEVYRVEAYVNEIKPDLFKAVELYDKAIDLDSKNITAYVGRGHVFSMLGMIDKSLEDLESAAKLDSGKTNSSVYSNICRITFGDSSLKSKTIENCNTVINMESADPTDISQAHQILATLYLRNGEYEVSKNHLESAKMLTPNDTNLYLSYALLGIYESDPLKIQENSEKAIKLSPGNATAYYYLARAKYILSEFDETINFLKKSELALGADVSLLFPYKSALEKNIYLMYANAYNKKGDLENELKYKDLSEK